MSPAISVIVAVLVVSGLERARHAIERKRRLDDARRTRARVDAFTHCTASDLTDAQARRLLRDIFSDEYAPKHSDRPSMADLYRAEVTFGSLLGVRSPVSRRMEHEATYCTLDSLVGRVVEVER